MTPRLTSRLLISALLRRVGDAGGSGAVLARGDETSGAILLVIRDAQGVRVLEKALGLDGGYRLSPCGPALGTDESAADSYWQRRRAQDDDLWVVELDGPEAERFAAETIASD